MIINKSLTLRGESRSLHAQLGIVSVRHDDPSGPVNVTLKDFIATSGIRAEYNDPGTGDHLTILRVKAGTGDLAPQGIIVMTIHAISVDVEDSFARTGAHQDPSLLFTPPNPVTRRTSGSSAIGSPSTASPAAARASNST